MSFEELKNVFERNFHHRFYVFRYKIFSLHLFTITNDDDDALGSFVRACFDTQKIACPESVERVRGKGSVER